MTTLDIVRLQGEIEAFLARHEVDEGSALYSALTDAVYELEMRKGEINARVD